MKCGKYWDLILQHQDIGINGIQYAQIILHFQYAQKENYLAHNYYSLHSQVEVHSF